MDGRVLLVAGLALALGFTGGYWGEAGRSAAEGGTALGSEPMQRELTAALALADTLERTRRIEDLMASLTADNVDGAAQAVAGSLVTTRDCDVRAFVNAWATFDPGAAFENALSWTATHKRGIGLYVASHRWALSGGGLEARAHAVSAPGRDNQDAAMTGLVHGWAESGDIAGVTEHLTGHSPGVGRIKFIGAVTSTLARTQGVDALLEWADAIPEEAGPAFRKEAFRGALTVATQRRPDLSVPWWEKHQHEPYAEQSLWVIPSLWIPQDPEAAITWALRLPTSDEVDSAIQTGIRRWYELDAGVASRWLARNPLPPRMLAMLTKQARRDIAQLRSLQ